MSPAILNDEHSYRIKALDFYFNYQWSNAENEGFYIKPLVLSATEGKPGIPLIDDNNIYFINNNVNELIHIDLSSYNLQIENTSAIFIGFEFIERCNDRNYENFNITVTPQKKSFDLLFIKGGCEVCDYFPLNLDDKNGLLLKYQIYYE